MTSRRAGYKKLWELLIDKDLKKKELAAAAGISQSSITKMTRGELVSLNVLLKICGVLHCDIGDIVEAIPEQGAVK